LRSQAATKSGPPKAGVHFFGAYLMESIRPNQSESTPVQPSSHHVGTILIRFVGILFMAVAVLALLYSR
jgi:hypothetical protein